MARPTQKDLGNEMTWQMVEIHGSHQIRGTDGINAVMGRSKLVIAQLKSATTKTIGKFRVEKKNAIVYIE